MRCALAPPGKYDEMSRVLVAMRAVAINSEATCFTAAFVSHDETKASKGVLIHPSYPSFPHSIIESTTSL